MVEITRTIHTYSWILTLPYLGHIIGMVTLLLIKRLNFIIYKIRKRISICQNWCIIKRDSVYKSSKWLVLLGKLQMIKWIFINFLEILVFSFIMLYCLPFHAKSHLISANFLWLYIDNYFRMTMCQPLFVVSLNKADLILELLMWKWRQTTTKILSTHKEIDKYKNISDMLMRKIEWYVRKW